MSLQNIAKDYDYTRNTKYSTRWSKDDDLSMSVTEESRKARQAEAPNLADEYYDLVTPIYESGWGKHFHYCYFQPGLTLKQSLKEYELDLANAIGLKKGMKVLDVGCGIGEPARTMAREIGCEVVGISINAWHVERGQELTREAGLEDLVTHVQGDYLNMPFDEGTFDAAYAFDATCYAPDLTHLYNQIYRVLKPGATFGQLDWVMTEKFDDENKDHVGVRNRIERGNGISNMPLIAGVRSSFAEAGFKIVCDEDTALRSKPGPWYYAPAGDLTYTVDWEDWWLVFKMHPLVRKIWYGLFWFLMKIHILDPEVISVMDTMAYCVDSVVEGGRKGIFTPMWMLVATKTDGRRKKSS